MTNWPPRAVTGVDTLGETPVILEEGGDGIIDLWVKIQDSGGKIQGQGSPAASLIQLHTDCFTIFGNSWGSVQAEALETGSMSGVELVELMGVHGAVDGASCKVKQRALSYK